MKRRIERSRERCERAEMERRIKNQDSNGKESKPRNPAILAGQMLLAASKS
jgi:hypothetical protein